MTLGLTVDNYFEYIMTIFAWMMNNQAWALLVDSGFFILPLVFQLGALFMKAREQGDDEGNKGRLLAGWLENKLYLAVFLIFMTCYPLFTVNFNTMAFTAPDMGTHDQFCSRQVIAPKDSNLSETVSEMNNKTVKLPLWWAFMHSAGKGFTHGLIAAIPCGMDFRQLRFEVQNTQIESPTLRQEIQDFVQQCFIPARNKLKQDALPMSKEEARDVDWIGSQILVSNFYPRYRSKLPRSQWPYDTTRDAGLPNQGTGGFPNCQNWWADSNIGLKYRILAAVQPTLSTRLVGLIQSDAAYSESVLRALVKPENITVSDGHVYTNYSSTSTGMVTKVTEGVGAVLTNVLSAPGLDAVRQVLPMIQGILLTIVTIATPIIIVLGRYEVKAIVTLSFVQFAIFFLSFWWELARWLDDNLFRALYQSETTSGSDWYWNLGGLADNSSWLLNLVMGVMFIVVPALWFGMMSWAGVNIGGTLSRAITDSSTKASDAGKKGADVAESTVKKGK